MEDEFGKKEYRYFVVDNEIYNISRLTTEVLHKIDEEVLLKTEQIIEQMKDKFSKYYVVDLFEYEKKWKVNIDVVEFNPINSLGLYLYNMTDDFSYNLRSVCATGGIGLWTTLQISEGDFSSHPNSNIFGKFQEIESDDYFIEQMSETDCDEDTLELLEKVKKLMNLQNKSK